MADESKLAKAAWERLRQLEQTDKTLLDALLAQAHCETSVCLCANGDDIMKYLHAAKQKICAERLQARGVNCQEKPNCDDAFSAEECRAELAQHLHNECTRLDVLAGMERMCQVTGRFTCQSRALLEACGEDMHKLAQQIKHAYKEKRRGVEVTWATLREVLAADPRATSTFTKIVEWISNDEVDVLRKCEPGVYQRCHRAKEKPGQQAFICNRSLFL